MKPRRLVKYFSITFGLLLVLTLTAFGVLCVTTIPLGPVLSTLGIKPQISGRPIQFESLELDYAGGFRIRARTISLPCMDNIAACEASESEAIIYPSTLLRGTLFPSEIRVRGLSLPFERRTDGIYFQGRPIIPIGSSSNSNLDTEKGKLLDLIDAMHRGADKDIPLDILRVVRLENSTVSLSDRVTNAEWKASSIELSLDENDGLLQSAISSLITRNDRQILLTVAVTHRTGDRTLAFSGEVEIPALEVLDGFIPERAKEIWNGTLALRAAGAWGDEGLRDDVNFHLEAANGSLRLPTFFSREHPLSSIVFDGAYNAANDGLLSIRSFEILDDRALKVAGSAEIRGITGAALGDASITLGDLSIKDLTRYVPDVAAPSLGTWLDRNLDKGKLSNIRASLHGPVREFPFSSEQTDRSFEFAFSFDGLEVKFANVLPPGEDLTGNFQIKNSRLEVQAKTGKVVGQSAEKVEVVIDTLYTQPALSAKGKVMGEAAELSKLLTPLVPELADLKVVTGQHDSRFTVSVPLFGPPESRELEFEAEGDLKKVAATYGSYPQKAEIVDAHLTTSLGSFAITGKGTVDGNSVEFSFTDGAPWFGPNLKASLGGALPTSVVAPLLKGTGVSLTGTANSTVSLAYAPPSGIHLKSTFDLGLTEVAVPQLAWHKKASEPASITASGVWNRKSGDLDLSNLSATGRGLDVRGSLKMRTQRPELVALSFAPFIVGNNDITLRFEDGRWNITGEQLEVVPVEGGGGLENKLPEALSLNLDVKKLLLGKQQFLGPRAVILVEHGAIQALNIEFETESGAVHRIRTSQEKNEPVIKVRSDNAGEVVRLLGIGDFLRGGKLEATIRSTTPGAFDPAHISGNVYLGDAEILHSKILLELLSFMSVTNLLAGRDQVPFSTISFNFRRASPKLELIDAKAAGPIIAIHFNGEIDEAKSSIQGKGEAVPFAVLGNIIRYVPIIGKTIARAQKNFVAAHYELEGPLNGPSITPTLISSLPDSFLNTFSLDSKSDE